MKTPSEWVECPRCGIHVHRERIEQHLAHAHDGEENKAAPPPAKPAPPGPRVRILPPGAKFKPKAPAPKPEHPVSTHLILYSRRGSRVTGKEFCRECGTRKDHIWRYAESNRGTVYLCSECKPLVFDRSFGHIDAMDHAESGGQWESNPHKH